MVDRVADLRIPGRRGHAVCAGSGVDGRRRPGARYRPAVFAGEAVEDINDADDLSRALREIDGALGALSVAFAGR